MINAKGLKFMLEHDALIKKELKAQIKSALMDSLYITEDFTSCFQVVALEDEPTNIQIVCISDEDELYMNYCDLIVARFPNRLLIDFLEENCGENIDNTFIELVDDCVNVTYNEFLNTLEEYKE